MKQTDSNNRAVGTVQVSLGYEKENRGIMVKEDCAAIFSIMVSLSEVGGQSNPDRGGGLGTDWKSALPEDVPPLWCVVSRTYQPRIGDW